MRAVTIGLPASEAVVAEERLEGECQAHSTVCMTEVDYSCNSKKRRGKEDPSRASGPRQCLAVPRPMLVGGFVSDKLSDR